jgi:hypothetical protein
LAVSTQAVVCSRPLPGQNTDNPERLSKELKLAITRRAMPLRSSIIAHPVEVLLVQRQTIKPVAGAVRCNAMLDLKF